MGIKDDYLEERKGKFKIKSLNGKIFILNYLTVGTARERAKEIANKVRSDLVLIDITDKSNFISTIRPN